MLLISIFFFCIPIFNKNSCVSSKSLISFAVIFGVAGVVMNRVHARGGEYARVGQGSIRKIIFQPYQFVCASEKSIFC